MKLSRLWGSRRSSGARNAAAGVLWEIENSETVRFRCRVGHAYSTEALLADQTNGTERVLWSAVGALEKSASVCRRLGLSAASEGLPDHYRHRAEEREQHATVIRQMPTAKAQ